MSLDPAIPRLVPEGRYVLVIEAEPTKETSQFGGFYYRIKFTATDQKGENFEFNDCFNAKMDRYHDLLRALGGQTQANGITLSPKVASYIGLKFEGDIRHRQAKNDKTKTIDEVVNIVPHRSEEADSKAVEAEPSPSQKEDDVPF